MDFEQYFRSDTRTRSVHHFRDLRSKDEREAKAIGALLNSSLFFFWFTSVGNGRNITGTDVQLFPVGKLEGPVIERLVPTFNRLMEDYRGELVRARPPRQRVPGIPSELVEADHRRDRRGARPTFRFQR